MLIFEKNITLLRKFTLFITPTACILICLWALYLRYDTFSNRTVTNDESFQLRSSVGPFKTVWFRNYYGDFSCFPGGYILTYPFIRILSQNGFTPDDIENDKPLFSDTSSIPWIIKLFNLPRWILALPHIIATIMGFYILYLLCQKYFTTMLGYLVTFSVICFNATLIEHAFEFRPYAVLPTLALGSLYLIDYLVSHYHTISKVKKCLIGLICLFIVIYHVFGIVLLILSTLFTLITYRSFNNRQPFSKDMVRYLILIFTLASLIWLWYSSINLGLIPGKKIFAGSIPPFDFIPNPLVNFGGFLKGIFGNLMGDKRLYILFIGAIVSLLLPHKKRCNQIGFFLLFVVLGVELVLFVTLKNKYWFLQRQFIWTMPYFAIFIGWCWDSLWLYLIPQKSQFINMNKNHAYA